MTSITCDHTFEDADSLLRRNWFFDTQDLFGLLHELSEDVFLQVWERGHTYPEPVRSALTDYANVPKTALKLRTQSVREIEESEEAYRMCRFERLKEHRAAFASPPRPRELVDDTFDELAIRLDKRRAIVEELKTMYLRTRRYIPMSQRKTLTYDDDPVLRDALIELERMENEFQQCKETIESFDKRWSELAWIDAALTDAAKRPSFLSNVRASESSA